MEEAQTPETPETPAEPVAPVPGRPQEVGTGTDEATVEKKDDDGNLIEEDSEGE
jgi:hypothetical protein